MKKRCSIAVILLLMISTLCTSCQTNNSNPNPGESTGEANADVPQISESSDVCLNETPTVVPEPPSFLSTASMNHKYGYIPVGQDRIDAENILSLWKKSTDFKTLKERTGTQKIEVSINNALIVYVTPIDRYDMKWVHAWRKNHDIQNVIELCEKRVYFYCTLYNTITGRNEYRVMIFQLGDFKVWEDVPFWTKEYEITEDTMTPGYYTAMNQLLNPEAFKQLEAELSKLSVTEIKDILCFVDSYDAEFFYYNTDKGEFVFTNFMYFDDYKFVPMSEFVEWSYQTGLEIKAKKSAG